MGSFPSIICSLVYNRASPKVVGRLKSIVLKGLRPSYSEMLENIDSID